MSLPHALRDRVRDIPTDIPYLNPGPEALRRWGSKLGMRSRPRIGIAWLGAPRAIDRSPLRGRSIPFEALEPLFRLPLEFHSLQQDVFDAAARAGMRQHGPQLHDFTETAALMCQMDAIVSIDTSVAHLAGGLGLPLDVMLPYASDYRWRGGERTAWYPRARLHRQNAPGNWTDVVDEVASALTSRFDAGRTF